MNDAELRAQLAANADERKREFKAAFEALVAEYGCTIAGQVVVTPDGRLGTTLYVTEVAA